MKKAQFQIDIIGIPKVKRQVSDYAQEYLRQEAKITRQIEQERGKRERMYSGLFSQLERQEKQHTRLIEQEEKKRQVARGFSLSSAGHLAQAAGFYRAGHLMRAGSMFGIGSSTEGGASGLIGLGAAAAGLSLAFGAVVVASKLVEVGFEGVSKVASDFMGAIGQLAGAKGLQAMIVESVTNQKLLNQARFAVSPGERLSHGELTERANALSTNAAAGAFSKEEWLKAFGAVGTLSGKQRSFSAGAQEFIGQYANVHGMQLGEAASVYGRIQAQNPSWSSEQIKSSLLAGFGVGQTLSFNPSELPESTTLLRQTAYLKGDSQANMQKLLVAGGLIKPDVGGMQNAGIAIQSMLKGFRQRGIGNLDTILQKVATNPLGSLPIHDIRGQNAAIALQAQLSERAGVSKDDFSTKANQARLNELKTLEGITMTQEEFNKAVEESLSPQEKLKAIYNKVANVLEEKLYKAVVQLTPYFEYLGDYLEAHSDEIVGAVKAIAQGLLGLATRLPDILSAIAIFITKLFDMLGYSDPRKKQHEMEGQAGQIGDNLAERRKALANLQGQQAQYGSNPQLEKNIAYVQSQIADMETKKADLEKKAKMFESIYRLENPDAYKVDSAPAAGMAPRPGETSSAFDALKPKPQSATTAGQANLATATVQNDQLTTLNEMHRVLQRIHTAQTQKHPIDGRH